MGSLRERAAISPLTPPVADLRDPLTLRRVLDDMRYSIHLCAEWIEHRHRKVTSSMAVGDETVILVDASGGAVTITLPLAVESLGREVNVSRVDASANSVTIVGSGGDTIDGAASKAVVGQWTNVRLVAVADSATSWKVL